MSDNFYDNNAQYNANTDNQQQPAQQPEYQQQAYQQQEYQQQAYQQQEYQQAYQQQAYQQQAYQQQTYQQQAYQQPVYQQQPSYQQNDGLDYKPIGMWGYLGYEILFALPCIGFILLLVFSFGGTKNVNVRNFARSYFCLFIIALVLGVIIGAFVGMLGFASFSYGF